VILDVAAHITGVKSRCGSMDSLSITIAVIPELDRDSCHSPFTQKAAKPTEMDNGIKQEIGAS